MVDESLPANRQPFSTHALASMRSLTSLFGLFWAVAVSACSLDEDPGLDDDVGVGGTASYAAAGGATAAAGGGGASGAVGTSGSFDAAGAAGAPSSTGGAKAGNGGTAGRAGGSAGDGTATAGTRGDAGADGASGAGGGATTLEWLPSWATSIQRTEERNLPPPLGNKTLRQFVWPTYSGDEVRLQLSNEKATSSVQINKVHIAMAGSAPGQIDPATDAAFTFSGSPSVTIPAGETMWTDPLDFPLEELKLTAVTIQFGTAVPNEITGHPGSRSTSYVADGDVVSNASLVSAETRDRWYFINAIEVMAPPEAFAVSVLGDSITDGYGVLNEFARWPDFLTLAIKADPKIKDKVSVLNAGMGANALLNGDEYMDAGVARVDRDILARPKVKWVIVLHGVNDIGGKSEMALVDWITGAYQQIIDKCHTAGILVYGSPITPFAGHSYAAGQALAIRDGINQWVMTSNAFDAVVDLASAVADPNDSQRLLQSLSNDGLHPNTAGYKAMGYAVDLSLFYETME